MGKKHAKPTTEPVNPELGARLKALRLESKLTQSRMAEQLNISQQVVSKIERGNTQHPRELKRIARFLGCTIAELMGEDPETAAASGTRAVPVLTYEEAAQRDSISKGNAMTTTRKFVDCSLIVGGNTYALVVKGDSMVNASGTPSYPPGCTIIVDPDRPPEPGRRVLYRLPREKAATFRQLEDDGSKMWLKPLNPQYPTVPLPAGAVYCGTVVQTHIDEQ